MTNVFADISKSIDPDVARCLKYLGGVARRDGLPLVIIGASARDVLFRHIFGLQPTRMTQDVDLMIQVASWIEFGSFQDRLCAAGLFSRVAHKPHRLLYDSRLPVDLVPFGDLEDTKGRLRWPPDGTFTMSTAGFRETLECALTVKTGPEDSDVVLVATPPALAIMKFIAWTERAEARAKDARDILFIAEHYGVAGHEDLLLDMVGEAEDSEAVDLLVASARLLGLHMRKLATPDTLREVQKVVREQIEAGEDSRFVAESIDLAIGRDRQIERGIRLLKGMGDSLERK